MVGGKAAKNKYKAETLPSGKYSFKIAIPAGFGALAITVNPPPVKAPATKAYLNSGEVHDLYCCFKTRR